MGTKAKVGAAAAVAVALAAGAYFVAPAPDGAVLSAEITASEAKGTIYCAVGVLSNKPEACYCTDNGTAGWITEAGRCWSEIRIVNGKAYSVGPETYEIGN